MLPATAALTFLVALSLLGIGILWRWTRLDAIESIAYGAVFGVVMGSTALVPLASWLGLTVPLVVGLGLASAVAGLILLAHPTRTPRSPGAAVGWIAAAVLAAFVVRWALLCASALTVDASGLRAGHIHIWGDWSQHLGDVTSFAYGDNFPPTHPRFTGHPLSYHYLTSVTVAAMVRLGMSPLAALPLHSFVFLCWLTLALFAFARRLSQDSSSAALATVLFLIGGGLGWWLSVRDALATPHFWQALWADPWNRSVQEAANFRWKDIVFAYLVPQRAVLYGLPIGLLASTLLLEGGRGGGWRPFVIAGIATGLLPLAHLGTMLALALITPFLVLLFPRRGWVAYFALWAALAVPVFLMQQGGGGGALHHIHWKVGWIAKPDPWWWFWLKNLGLFAPWFLWALLDRDTVPRTNARFLWAFMPIFVIANLVVFQPWDWDNTKVFLFWYLAGCVLVAASVVRWGRRGLAAKVASGIAVATMLFSGVLAHLDQVLGRDRLVMLTPQELKLAEVVREKTPPHALFLAGLQHNHPVPMLAGRRVVMSYTGWMWSQGIESTQREIDVKDMYALTPDGLAELKAFGVDDVVIGPWERDHFHPDERAFARAFRKIIDLPPYAVYEVRPAK